MTKLQDFLNSPLTQVTNMRAIAKQGDLFGLELECEGSKVDWDGSAPKLLEDWVPHNDGSLRAWKGGVPCEWVFNGPVKHDLAKARVGTLFDYFEKRKSVLHLSNRTSTHVHFNMADKNAYQAINLFILFTILEDLMDRYCGEDRRGNLFCLSSRHAHQQVEWIMSSCFQNYSFGNMKENWRYCSLNMAALNKFGTVEFRGMRGLGEKEEVLDWLDILNDFCQYACYTMKNPVTVLEQISMKGPEGFLQDIFSRKNYNHLTRGLSQEEISTSIYDGLRIVQMLVYKVGTEFDQVRLRGRDFWASFDDGRDAKPIRDVDPEAIRPGLGLGGGGRLRAARANPIEFLAAQALPNVPRPALRGQRVRVNPAPDDWGEPDAPAPAPRDPLDF